MLNFFKYSSFMFLFFYSPIISIIVSYFLVFFCYLNFFHLIPFYYLHLNSAFIYSISFALWRPSNNSLDILYIHFYDDIFLSNILYLYTFVFYTLIVIGIWSDSFSSYSPHIISIKFVGIPYVIIMSILEFSYFPIYFPFLTSLFLVHY